MRANQVIEAIAKIDATGMSRPYLQKKYAVSYSQIISAENELKYKFPSSYRYFLEHFGSGDFKGLEFYGLVPGNSVYEIPNSLWLTMNLRETESLPEDLFVIEDLGDGALACLWLSKMSHDNECPVILWDYGEMWTENPHVLASCFGEYFFNRITEKLAF